MGKAEKQDIEKLRKIFTLVENTLRKESILSREVLDSRLEEVKNKDYRNMNDKDIFWMIVCVVFYSGMRASTVSRKTQAIKNYFYDFEKVKDFSSKEICQIMSDPNTIHHRKKIEACIENAKEFHSIIVKYGSFKKYLGSFGDLSDDENINRLRSDLRKRFRYFGERTVNHFLMELGVNVLKPDRVICRIFSRLGLITSKDDVNQAIDVGRRFALATSCPIRYIDLIFVKYGQMGRNEYLGLEDGICLEKNPKCEKCGVAEYCKLFSENKLA